MQLELNAFLNLIREELQVFEEHRGLLEETITASPTTILTYGELEKFDYMTGEELDIARSYLLNVPGDTVAEKLRMLADTLNNAVKATEKKYGLSGSNLDQPDDPTSDAAQILRGKMGSLLSALYTLKYLYYLFYGLTSESLGFFNETLFGLMMGGNSIEAGAGTIGDFMEEDGTLVSLKTLAAGSKVEGSFIQMMLYDLIPGIEEWKNKKDYGKVFAMHNYSTARRFEKGKPGIMKYLYLEKLDTKKGKIRLQLHEFVIDSTSFAEFEKFTTSLSWTHEKLFWVPTVDYITDADLKKFLNHLGPFHDPNNDTNVMQLGIQDYIADPRNHKKIPPSQEPLDFINDWNKVKNTAGFSLKYQHTANSYIYGNLFKATGAKVDSSFHPLLSPRAEDTNKGAFFKNDPKTTFKLSMPGGKAIINARRIWMKNHPQKYLAADGMLNRIRDVNIAANPSSPPAPITSEHVWQFFHDFFHIAIKLDPFKGSIGATPPPKVNEKWKAPEIFQVKSFKNPGKKIGTETIFWESLMSYFDAAVERESDNPTTTTTTRHDFLAYTRNWFEQLVDPSTFAVLGDLTLIYGAWEEEVEGTKPFEEIYPDPRYLNFHDAFDKGTLPESWKNWNRTKPNGDAHPKQAPDLIIKTKADQIFNEYIQFLREWWRDNKTGVFSPLKLKDIAKKEEPWIKLRRSQGADTVSDIVTAAAAARFPRTGYSPKDLAAIDKALISSSAQIAKIHPGTAIEAALHYIGYFYALVTPQTLDKKVKERFKNLATAQKPAQNKKPMTWEPLNEANFWRLPFCYGLMNGNKRFNFSKADPFAKKPATRQEDRYELGKLVLNTKGGIKHEPIEFDLTQKKWNKLVDVATSDILGVVGSVMEAAKQVHDKINKLANNLHNPEEKKGIPYEEQRKISLEFLGSVSTFTEVLHDSMEKDWVTVHAGIYPEETEGGDKVKKIQHYEVTEQQDRREDDDFIIIED